MTLLLVPGEGGSAQQIENQAVGLEAVEERVGTWQEAMANPEFVREMDAFLEDATESDAEIFNLSTGGELNR